MDSGLGLSAVHTMLSGTECHGFPAKMRRGQWEMGDASEADENRE